MAVFSVRRAATGDSPAFFAAMAGWAFAMIGIAQFSALVRFAQARASDSLLISLCPLETLSPIYGALVLLPSMLAAAAIGVPSAFRTLFALRPRHEGGVAELVLFVLTVLAFVVFILRLGTGWLGVGALFSLVLLGTYGASPYLASLSGRTSSVLLMLACAGFSGLAWLEWKALGGGEPSTYLGPTCLVFGALLAELALWIRGSAWLFGARRPGAPTLLAGGIFFVWFLLAERSAAGSVPVDWAVVEPLMAAVAALALGAASALNWNGKAASLE